MVGKALSEAAINPNDASSYGWVQHDDNGKPSINIRLLDAYLSYYMHIRKPQKLSDQDWAIEVQNLHFIRTEERKASEAN